MNEADPANMKSSVEQRQMDWAKRAASFARDAAPRTRPFAAALVDLVGVKPGDRVLDVATGSGVVAVEAALRAGPTGAVLATDLVPEWEPFVAETAKEAGVDNVSFQATPSEKLALPDASFDVALSQFGLMFADEPVVALREMHRVLRPGGNVGVAVWSVLEKLGVFLLTRVVSAELPPSPPAPGHTPWRLGEPGMIEALMTDAGFHDVTVTPTTLTYEVTDPHREWAAWRENIQGPAQALQDLPEERQRQIEEKALATLEGLREEDGVIRVASEALLVSAVR
jgi:ubiquinone/menaquinone biosynthesis C-methylase UbiE